MSIRNYIKKNRKQNSIAYLTICSGATSLNTPQLAAGSFIYAVAILMSRYTIIAFVLDIAILFYFKYINFFIYNITALLSNFSQNAGNISIEIFLPIGISFYIFQSMSYVVDVYRGKVEAQKNFAKFFLYISFFPQLIAGPIVRYSDVADEIENRNETIQDLYHGTCRFIIGLSKKVLIADVLGISVDKIYSLPQGQLTTELCWSAALFYTLEIYYDFSGYSDMAIGIARMFGFHFGENFNRPYESKNMTEFWRKWHISLSSWLRDYVYIPCGGNRGGG